MPAKQLLKGFAIALLVVFGIGGVNLAYQSVFAPAQEQVRTDTYNNSAAYVRGINQDIAKYRMDALSDSVSDSQREQLKTMALQKAQRLDLQNLDHSNREWIQSIKDERGL